jgi:hypothetical protein
MATQGQNSSREMTLPAYKAAISPGPPLSRPTTSNSARLRSVDQLAHLAEPVPIRQYEIRDTRCQIRTNLCKTNPISKNPKISATFFQTKGYDNETPFGPTQNEPKRTQNEPNFSPLRGPQSQNEPKQTQSKANSSLLILLAMGRYAPYILARRKNESR